MEWSWNVIRAWALEHSFNEYLWIPCLESDGCLFFFFFILFLYAIDRVLLFNSYLGLIDLQKILKVWIDVRLLRL